MRTSRGSTVINVAVAFGAIIVLIVLAMVAFARGRARANDALRITDLAQMIVAFSDAHGDGAVLCAEDGTRPCGPGMPLRTCRIYQSACNGDARDDVTAQYVDLPTLSDPVWRTACSETQRTDCDYAFLRFDNLMDYDIAFSTEGKAVQGLASGRTHRVSQNGEWR